MSSWIRDRLGWVFVVAAVGVITLGGLRWPPGGNTYTSYALAVALVVIGVLLDRIEAPQRDARRRATEQGQRLGWAFGSKWPDAPDVLVEWISALESAQLAEVHSWLTIFGDGMGVDDLATIRNAPERVKAILAKLDEGQRVTLQEVLEQA